MHTFRSDNNAGLCPEARQALLAADDGSHQAAYSDDEFTARAVRAFQAVFGAETRVWFVATGTAANTLAIASLTRPWSQLICHVNSHCNNHESTAPERITHCRMAPVRTEDSKLTLRDIQRAAIAPGFVHEPQPGVVTVSNATELGTVYTPAELKALCQAAHAAGYAVHVDGARFANAVAALGCNPRELSIDAGVDALCFGGTKNGLAMGEAVLFFPQGDGRRFHAAVEAFPYHRMGTGHLLSKHRFLAAPFTAVLEAGAWLRHAAHANAMATRLGDGLCRMRVAPRFPVQSNGVFVSLPPGVDAHLRSRGHSYYPFGDPSWGLSRLMCSFDTKPAEVDALLDDIADAIGR